MQVGIISQLKYKLSKWFLEPANRTVGLGRREHS